MKDVLKKIIDLLCRFLLLLGVIWFIVVISYAGYLHYNDLGIYNNWAEYSSDEEYNYSVINRITQLLKYGLVIFYSYLPLGIIRKEKRSILILLLSFLMGSVCLITLITMAFSAE
jgi:hypothetical protein